MTKFNIGDRIIFNCSFENADARIERGDEGVVKAGPGKFDRFYFVVSKRIVWMVKENEMRKK